MYKSFLLFSANKFTPDRCALWGRFIRQSVDVVGHPGLGNLSLRHSHHVCSCAHCLLQETEEGKELFINDIMQI